MKLTKVVFIPDSHHPYVDKKAWALLLKTMKEFCPDIMVVGGDFADFYCVSSHDKNPERENQLESELEAVNKALDELDSIGAKRRIFVAGNHEDRLDRYLKTRAPELYSIVRIPELFKLKRRGWEYIPYKAHVKIGKLHITHDTGTAGATAHAKALADFQDNVVINHTHRTGYTVVGNAKGVPHVGAMFGWLGDVKQVDYMHSVKANRDWSLGFGIGYLHPNGNIHIFPMTIVDYSVVLNGKLIKV